MDLQRSEKMRQWKHSQILPFHPNLPIFTTSRFTQQLLNDKRACRATWCLERDANNGTVPHKSYAIVSAFCESEKVSRRMRNFSSDGSSKNKQAILTRSNLYFRQAFATTQQELQQQISLRTFVLYGMQ